MRSLLAHIATVTAFSAAPAFADEVTDLADSYGPLLHQCLQDAGPETEVARQCIGAASQACMEKEDGGYTTLGMSWCMAAETQLWDAALNREYQAALKEFGFLDEEDQAYFPEFANRVESLRAAQRAWLAFYDAECALDYAVWGAGSMRHIAGNACQMELKAARTLELQSKRRTMQ